jgi:DNA (cytosine-5)-methyltransferase 1
MSPASNHAQLNTLWRHYLRIVKQLKPPVFVIENVPEFLHSQEFLEFVKRAKKLGYKLDYGVLNAAEFGVPQKRKRGFTIAALGVQPHLPVPTGEVATVRDAIGDLPLKPTDKDLHIGRNPTPKSIERYKCIPPGGNRFDLMRKRPDITPDCWLNKPTGSTDVFGRLEWDKPALTIRTEFFKPEKGRYLHPQAHRPITHREAARLQSFSDDFVFVGSKIEIAKQIGNAVPPKLAKAVAEAVIAVLPQVEELLLGRALEQLTVR